MATIGNKYLTLADALKRQDPDGAIAVIIEMLVEKNEILADAIAIECNDGTKHKTTMRTGIPEATFRAINEGVPLGKSTTKQISETTAHAEARSMIDKLLVDIQKNPAAFRLSEAEAFIQGMNNTIAEKLFYGNVDLVPKEFTGFAPRYNSLSAENGKQIVDGGGTGSDNTSVWFVHWGEATNHLIYPDAPNITAGLTRTDLGEQRVLDANGNPYQALEELFTWDIGLATRDWEYTSRIANIDVSDLIAGTVDIYALMRKAYWKLRDRRNHGMTTAIYCNAEVLEALDAKQTTDAKVQLRPTEVEGKEVLMYRGIPLRECDALVNTEARVV